MDWWLHVAWVALCPASHILFSRSGSYVKHRPGLDFPAGGCSYGEVLYLFAIPLLFLRNN